MEHRTVTLEFRPKYVTPETQYALYRALQAVFEAGIKRPVHETVRLRQHFVGALQATERLRIRMSFEHSLAIARSFQRDARLRHGYDVRLFYYEQPDAA